VTLPIDDVIDRFAQFARAISSPAFIVTAAARGRRQGCLVGFATQASIHPPRLLVCISVKNATFETAERATHLGVHLIPADRPDLAELFGGETGDDVDKFAGRRVEAGPGGAPLLLECPLRLSGRILDRHALGDHVGYLLEPVAVWADEEGEQLDIRRAGGIDPGHPA
jgi:flavin reductase (DIM6/NTAB) family NADH-FMN oxidoreductase RutF